VKLGYGEVALYAESFFTEAFSIDTWNDYWDLLDICGWQYMDFMVEMEKRVSKEWIAICNASEKNLCSN
jgi:hypothetical protein